MRFEHQGDLQFSLMVLDDGELPTSILEQFPAAVIRHVEAEVRPQPAATHSTHNFTPLSRPVGTCRPQNWRNDTELIVDVTVMALIVVVSTLLSIFLWLACLA
jgi:hypothetical protein